MQQNSLNDFDIHDWQEKSTFENNSAIQSSQLCLECGMCCTGLIFSHVSISHNAFSRLPTANVKTVDDTIKMSFPCSFFKEGCCSVYEVRPKKCQSYSCYLLENLIKGEVSFSNASKTINIAKSQALWLLTNIPSILNIPKKNSPNLRDELYFAYKKFIVRLDKFNTLLQRIYLITNKGKDV